MSTDTVTETNTDTELDFPSLWGVKFLNDDFTPMDFVMLILMQNFSLSNEDANTVTMTVHEKGEAVVGAYPKDIAFTKANLSETTARHYGHPLRLEPIKV